MRNTKQAILLRLIEELEALEPGEVAARPSTHAAAYRKENLRLKTPAGREDPGSGFFQRCLAKSRGSTPEERQNWRDGIFEQIREVMLLQGSLSIERMCQLVPVSRRSFYRSLKEKRPVEEETEERSVVQQIALEHRRRYGYRRITAELRRRGMQVNHKRVARTMREDNLLALQPKCFKVTTDSNHKLEIYLNLAVRVKLTEINQLWVADVTYIRLKAEFVFLAVILDGLSRKVVGWALHRTLAMRLTVGALEQAIERRQPQPGLVRHSDRGLQYARAEYIAILEKYHMIPSMSSSPNTGLLPSYLARGIRHKPSMQRDCVLAPRLLPKLFLLQSRDTRRASDTTSSFRRMTSLWPAVRRPRKEASGSRQFRHKIDPCALISTTCQQAGMHAVLPDFAASTNPT